MRSRLPGPSFLGYELHARLVRMLQRIDATLSGDYIDDPDRFGNNPANVAERSIRKAVRWAEKRQLWSTMVLWRSAGGSTNFIEELDASHLENIIRMLTRSEQWGWLAVMKIEQRRRTVAQPPKIDLSHLDAISDDDDEPEDIPEPPKPVTWNELFGLPPGGGVIGGPSLTAKKNTPPPPEPVPEPLPRQLPDLSKKRRRIWRLRDQDGGD